MAAARRVEVAINHWPSRFEPPQAAAERAKSFEASGVVDGLEPEEHRAHPAGMIAVDASVTAR